MLISDPCPEEQRSKSWPLAVFAPEPDRTGRKDVQRKLCTVEKRAGPNQTKN
jgi:hypothetical protein